MLSLPPLSLYIHFPWCIHKCPYCDFNSHVIRGNIPERDYIQALLRDLYKEKSHIQGRVITSVYLGGGTPSLFSGQYIAYLFQQMRSMVDISVDAEISIEANPESVTLEKLACYREIGINHISLGIQSLQDRYLKRLGRAHDGYIAEQAIEAVINTHFTNFNVDLMYGLPGQTEQDGLHDIKSILSFHPPHLSWYQLTLEPNTSFFKKPPTLPDEEVIAEVHSQGSEVLARVGLFPYEISAFSQAGFECQHNNHYWSFGDYVGIGAGAHSKITQTAEGTIIRYSKWSNPKIYLSEQSFQDTQETISPQQLPFEFMLNALRCYRPISRPLFEERTGLAWEVLNPYVNKAVEKGLLEQGDQALIITPFGRRFYNDLVTLFL